MCTPGPRSVVILTIASFSLVLHPGPASADPVALNGFLSGDVRFALVQQQLDLTFPDFKVSIGIEPQLNPGFCFDGCVNGTPVPFTQSLGVFSSHSTGLAGSGTIDADVTGLLRFFGPTEFISVAPELGGDVLRAPVEVRGFLRITQPNRILFNGTFVGSALASVIYENRFSPSDTRLGGYQFEIDGVATTPEPASFVLLGTGLAWLVRRGRKGRLRKGYNQVS